MQVLRLGPTLNRHQAQGFGFNFAKTPACSLFKIPEDALAAILPTGLRQERDEHWKKMRDARGEKKKARLKRLGESLPSAGRVVLLNG